MMLRLINYYHPKLPDFPSLLHPCTYLVEPNKSVTSATVVYNNLIFYYVDICKKFCCFGFVLFPLLRFLTFACLPLCNSFAYGYYCRNSARSLLFHCITKNQEAFYNPVCWGFENYPTDVKIFSDFKSDS